MTKKQLLDSSKKVTEIARESYVKSFLNEPNDINRKIFWEQLYLNITEQNQILMQSQTALTNHNISLPQPSLTSAQISSPQIDEIVDSFFQIPDNNLSTLNSSNPNQGSFEQEIYRILNNESPPNQTIIYQRSQNNLSRELTDENPSPLKKTRSFF
jgi:hypothetical protein